MPYRVPRHPERPADRLEEIVPRHRLFVVHQEGRKGCIVLQGEPIFVDEVTVLARPEPNPLKRLWVRARYRLALGTRLRALGSGARRPASRS